MSTARRAGPALSAVLVLVASHVAALGRDASPRMRNGAPTSPLSVRITSPLGRTGIAGTVRIVARVSGAEGVGLKPVRFLVDGALLATVADGPPYTAEWVDDNPFARRELTVEVEDAAGRADRASVVLEPFEITELSQVTSVLLEAAVYDRRGRFVAGLSPGDFVLHEDGVPQKLDMVAQEALPATFALLVDSSQSMSRRFGFVRDAASRFVTFLRPQDRVIVAPFTTRLGTLTGPTADRFTIVEALDTLRAEGGTAILDALGRVAEAFTGAEGRRAIILMTDGYDEHSTSSFDDVLASVKAARVTVYVVGIGGVAGISLKGERLLKRVAFETGGAAFFPPREQELISAYEAVAADAQHRYLITYTPTNQAPDGRWRAISLVTTSDDRVVRTRTGYLAPSPPPVRPSLEFTVTDSQQRYADIAADDLLVVEDGAPQTIESFHEATTPVSLMLALDASGSMRKSTDAVKDAARGFVEALRPEDALGLIVFADRARFVHDLATVRAWTLEAIDKYQASGGTALYDALCDSLLRLKRVDGRRVAVVMTDGRDEDNPGTRPGSARGWADVITLVRETGAIVFPIGLGTNVDRPRLEELSRISGGRAYFPADAQALERDFHGVLENLRRRFVVGYTSTNPSRDGRWRQVEISSRVPTLQVASPGGYFGPEK